MAANRSDVCACRVSRNTLRAQSQHRPQQVPTPSCARNSRRLRQPSATAEPISRSVTALQTQTNMMVPIWSRSACPGACAASDKFRPNGKFQLRLGHRAALRCQLTMRKPLRGRHSGNRLAEMNKLVCLVSLQQYGMNSANEKHSHLYTSQCQHGELLLFSRISLVLVVHDTD